jgi:5-methylcytosine-specific restriction endonuclease McrA
MRDFVDPQYKEWRLKIYKRDRFQCQMPGCPNKKYLQAHHIRRWVDAPELRFDVKNGITLCKACHELVTGCENNYIDMFERIVNEKVYRQRELKKNIKSFIRIRKRMLGNDDSA